MEIAVIDDKVANQLLVSPSEDAPRGPVENPTDVIIFLPGLGRGASNTGDRIAEVLAHAYDRLEPGRKYSTKSDAAVAAPRGLKVAKTVVRGSQPVLQVFELDYKARLGGTGNGVGPPPSPGVIRSAKYAIFALVVLIYTSRRGAKTWTAKLQLLLGLFGALLLIFGALFSIYAALVAAGLGFPSWLGGIFGESAAGWTFGITATGTVITWTAIRQDALALATTLCRLMDYISNRERLNDSISLILEDGIDGLCDAQWTGKIHLLGYSFGSLIVYDAVLPKVHALKSAAPIDHVSSIVTVGCPLDIVRLYFKNYASDRTRRVPGARWVNIFNAADLFGSNLHDGDDTSVGRVAPEPLGCETRHDSPPIRSTRYLDEELTISQLFMMRGFRTHAGYWGEANDGHCFSEQVLRQWLPANPPRPAIVAKSRNGRRTF